MALDIGGEVLPTSDCFGLLASRDLGRVAVSERARPAIFPVPYRLVDGAVTFLAPAGGRLARATIGSAVAFEVDAFDPDGAEGWSVMVLGTAHRRAADATTPSAGWPWAGVDRTEIVAIPVERISGRRFRRPPEGSPPDFSAGQTGALPPLSDRQQTTIDAVLARERARHLIGQADQAQAGSRLAIERSEELLRERAGRIDALEREVAQLREALEGRTAISTAIGILMARGNVTSDEAFDHLRRASQRQNRKLRAVAGEVVERHEGHIRGARPETPGGP